MRRASSWPASAAGIPDRDRAARRRTIEDAGKPTVLPGEPVFRVVGGGWNAAGMNNGDEQLLPHQTYATLIGGPLGGLLLDIMG